MSQPQRPAVSPARAPAPVPVQRGTQPSTLQAQAAALVPASPRQQIAAASPAGPQGRFEIQIGAYASVEEAQRNLSAAQARAGKLLNNYPSVTHAVSKAGRPVIRARFRGFDAQTAANTCTELRRQGTDCFVMTAE